MAPKFGDQNRLYGLAGDVIPGHLTELTEGRAGNRLDAAVIAQAMASVNMGEVVTATTALSADDLAGINVTPYGGAPQWEEIAKKVVLIATFLVASKVPGVDAVVGNDGVARIAKTIVGLGVAAHHSGAKPGNFRGFSAMIGAGNVKVDITGDEILTAARRVGCPIVGVSKSAKTGREAPQLDSLSPQRIAAVCGASFSRWLANHGNPPCPWAVSNGNVPPAVEVASKWTWLALAHLPEAKAEMAAVKAAHAEFGAFLGRQFAKKNMPAPTGDPSQLDIILQNPIPRQFLL